MHRLQNRLFTISAALLACSFHLGATPPSGWHVAGTNPGGYDGSLDSAAAYQGLPSTYLKSNDGAVRGFGTLMQDFSAADYLGKRVRLSANVKSEGLTEWAGLWMRVDNDQAADTKKTTVAFDNMGDRPIRGTSDWRNYSVVLDVPAEATGIYLEFYCRGREKFG